MFFAILTVALLLSYEVAAQLLKRKYDAAKSLEIQQRVGTSTDVNRAASNWDYLDPYTRFGK